MKKSKLLQNKHPELIKEWDFEKNTKPVETVTAGCDYLAHWICSKGHKWQAVVYSRTGSHPCGCPHCSPTNRKTSPWYNLAVLHPHLLDEWDYEVNGIDPHLVSPRTCHVYQWKCRYGHTWPSRVSHRVNGSGCPDCHGHSSKQQVFIFCEVKYFFPEALSRHKINKIECDIYLPDEKIGIEFDSTRWHNCKVAKDEEKVRKLREFGIEIINIREYSMPMVNRLTVGYRNNSGDIEITKNLMALLGKILNRQDLLEYSVGNRPVNEQEYLKELKAYPNSLGRALATQNPELSKEWDYNANNGLTPNDFTPFSHHIASWICPVGHPYEASIANRNNRHKTNCPHCQNHSSLSYSRNKIREPIFPKRIRIRKNYYRERKEREIKCQKLPLE